ncbi:MAG TPA: LysR family transcriptional regulator [Polyangiaceae bacterium]|nr:LysR family transcriptional regulator [Polyangiaceae bacterium]
MSDLHHLAQVDLNLLVVLDELLRSRSTTIAARRLGRTQSAVSHALARLRATFDDPLLIRAGSALEPTASAERLQAPLREMLLRAAALVRGSSGAFDPARIERTFVVACADYAEVILLPRLLPVLRRQAPGVDVVTRFLGDDFDRAVQAREVDLAYGTRFRTLSGIVVQPVRSEELVVLLRRGHPALGRRMTVRGYAALDHVLVAPRGLPGSAVDTALEPLGLSRRVVLRMPHFTAAAVVVSKTELVVTLPEGLAHEVADGLGLVSVPLPLAVPGFTFSIGYSSAFEDDAPHRWFRERVVEAASSRDGSGQGTRLARSRGR